MKKKKQLKRWMTKTVIKDFCAYIYKLSWVYVVVSSPFWYTMDSSNKDKTFDLNLFWEYLAVATLATLYNLFSVIYNFTSSKYVFILFILCPFPRT